MFEMKEVSDLPVLGLFIFAGTGFDINAAVKMAYTLTNNQLNENFLALQISENMGYVKPINYEIP